MKYDFSGWVTKNDILCTDGRVIRKDAFKDCDGKKVPLVWNHQHNDPENVLGNVLLHNEDNGVRGYGSFNNTRKAQSAKMMLEHGDIDSLSICANHLKQDGGNVLHGEIKEVSLVLAGANSGAHIDEVIRHGEVSEDEFVLYLDDMIDIEHCEITDDEPEKEIKHADKEEKSEDDEEKGSAKDKTVGDVIDTLNEKQKKVVFYLIGKALGDIEEDEEDEENETAVHADKTLADDETIGDVLATLNEEQKEVVMGLIAMALESGKKNKEAKHSDDDEDEDYDDEDDADDNQNEYENTEGGNEMNVFENNREGTEVLTHAEQVEILNDAKALGTLKDAILKHGITDISNAYPDYTNVTDKPEFISRDQGWVTKVLSGVHHTPFARIRTLFADLTPDNARAKGYLEKNTQKIEEVISLLKRETDPTTVYKLQKLDRDDVLDITDFDVVAWLRDEMKIMLNEELARAYLIGDGRSATAADKINEQRIRPIWTMEALFVINAVSELASTATADDIAKAVIKSAVKGFDDYDGSGNTVCFMAPDTLSTMLLLEDGFGHRLYKSKAELASAMLVDDVIPVPPMKNKSRTVTISSVDHTRVLAGIIVDLRDYNVGMVKGGQVNWFDDFNIDFNKLEYMIETRQSGSLVKPKSAIVLEYEVASGN